MRLALSIMLVMLFFASVAGGENAAHNPLSSLPWEDRLNLYCLRHSYPQIISAARDNDGNIWLNLRNGQRIPYMESQTEEIAGLNVDVRDSMSQIYPLEPQRLYTDEAPGRKRPYKLFYELYGHNKVEAQKNLQSVFFMGKRLQMASQAAQSFAGALPKLRELAKNPEYKAYLKPEGAFYWRKIAGEPWLSAHSFGIAADFGVSKSPYWRWNKLKQHPLQLTYPAEIVKTMEDHGFIWGGKWREYDLMHFEYRPEIICKSRLQRYMRPNLPHAHTDRVPSRASGRF